MTARMLFVGYVVPEERISDYSGASVAGNRMQLGIIRSLYRRPDVELMVLAIPPIASFPKDRRVLIHADELMMEGSINVKYIGYINFPIIKQITQIFNLYLAIQKYEIKSEDILFSSNMYPEVGIPVVWSKKKSKALLCALIADLPLDPFGKRNLIRMFCRRLYNKMCEKSILQSDKVIVLNKKAAHRYAPEIPYIVVDGGVEKKELTGFRYIHPSRKNIVYTGALTDYSGVMNLVEAMDYIKNTTVELDIYGGGPLSDTIKQIADSSGRIVFHGRIDNKEARKAQSEAWLLANPRPVEDEIAQVTFPSKIIEYMCSGTPVLSTKLNGLTEEYRDCLFMTGDKPQEMADSIDHIATLDDSEMERKASSAYSFVFDNKTWDVHVSKMVNFIMGRVAWQE